MLLKEKKAVIYGAGGSIGRLVARGLAREGAEVQLCGRTRAPLEIVADAIKAAGGMASVHIVDASDAEAVTAHLDTMVTVCGAVDISINLIGVQDDQGTPLDQMSLDAFIRPVLVGTQAHFVTATAAARQMTRQGAGVILALTAVPARLALPLVGGFGSYCAAVEAFYRTLAAEVGEKGIRVCWLRSAGSPETFGPDVSSNAQGEPAGLADKAYLDRLRETTLLRRFPRAEEVAEAAILAASDRASAMTGAAFNLSCGQFVD